MLRIGLLCTLVLAVALGGAGAAPGVALADGPDFSLSADPTTVFVPAGISPSSAQVTVTPTGGFAGIVTFQVSGLPSGTSATVVPNSTGASIVFSSLSSAPSSSSTVTVTGTSGALTHTVAIGLQVVQPVHDPVLDFSLSASPTSATLLQGSVGRLAISVTPIDGFTGSVDFSASGLPNGVT
ncbi:MAG TPA: hypothetical protein VIC57_15495, partial [Candidatus Dormibacteraeota bacterium]